MVRAEEEMEREMEWRLEGRGDGWWSCVVRRGEWVEMCAGGARSNGATQQGRRASFCPEKRNALIPLGSKQTYLLIIFFIFYN